MSAVQRRSTQTAACSGAVLEDRQESRSHSQVWRTPAQRQATVTRRMTLTAERYVAVEAEMEMGQWPGSWVTASDPLTHDEITQYHYQATYFCFPLRLATI